MRTTSEQPNPLDPPGPWKVAHHPKASSGRDPNAFSCRFVMAPEPQAFSGTFRGCPYLGGAGAVSESTVGDFGVCYYLFWFALIMATAGLRNQSCRTCPFFSLEEVWVTKQVHDEGPFHRDPPTKKKKQKQHPVALCRWISTSNIKVDWRPVQGDGGVGNTVC